MAVASNIKLFGTSYKALTKKLMRAQILTEGKRVDGRALDEVRPISSAVGILPRKVHGSAVFQRGLTQVLSATTLGTPSDAQEVDDLNPSNEKPTCTITTFPLLRGGDAPPPFPGSPGSWPMAPWRSGR